MSVRRERSSDPRAVVGFYGDPDATWGIGLEAQLGLDTTDVRPDVVRRRLDELSRRHAHLGQVAIEYPPDPDWESSRQGLLAGSYLPGDPMVRLGVRPARGTRSARVVVAAHHGVCDGLGLLAILGAAAGVEIATSAGGVGARAPVSGFLRRSAGRLVEAVTRPPPRWSGTQTPGRGEHLLESTVPVLSVSTATLVVAVVAAFDRAGGQGDPVLAMGASRRRPGAPLAPDRQTTFLRLRSPRPATAGAVGEALAGTDPEPHFPETSVAGLAPLAARLLRDRLGATATLSNLGLLTARPAVLESVAMYAALNGPRAVVVGLASTAVATTVTVRMRSSDFTASEASRTLAVVVDSLQAQGIDPS